MPFQQPDQFRGPFPSLFHLPGISEGEGLCEGLVERGSLGSGSLPARAPRAVRVPDDVPRIAKRSKRF
jgi:hypothetical protein